MNEALTAVWARYGALTLRERALIAASLIALVWLVWDWTIHQAINRRMAAAQRTIVATVARIQEHLLMGPLLFGST